MKKSLWERFSKWFMNQINIDEVEDYKSDKEKLKEEFPNVEVTKLEVDATKEVCEAVDSHIIDNVDKKGDEVV